MSKIYLWNENRGRLIPVISEDVAFQIIKYFNNYKIMVIDEKIEKIVECYDDFIDIIKNENLVKIEKIKSALIEKFPLYQINLNDLVTNSLFATIYIRGNSLQLPIGYSVGWDLIRILKKTDEEYFNNIDFMGFREKYDISSIVKIASAGETHDEDSGLWEMAFDQRAMYKIGGIHI